MAIITPPKHIFGHGALDSDIVLLEYLEKVRSTSRAAAAELHAAAGEVEARLKSVSRNPIAAWTPNRRANYIAKAIENGSESCNVVAQWAITAANRFKAAYDIDEPRGKSRFEFERR